MSMYENIFFAKKNFSSVCVCFANSSLTLCDSPTAHDFSREWISFDIAHENCTVHNTKYLTIAQSLLSLSLALFSLNVLISVSFYYERRAKSTIAEIFTLAANTHSDKAGVRKREEETRMSSYHQIPLTLSQRNIFLHFSSLSFIHSIVDCRG